MCQSFYISILHNYISILSVFGREVTCCGPIFKGPYGEVIMDPTLLKPCVNCLEAGRQRRQISDSLSASETISPIHSASVSPAHSVELVSPSPSSSEMSMSIVKQSQVPKNNFSDSSSDSGYDECSSQGADGGNKKNTQKIKPLPSCAEQLEQISSTSLTIAANVAADPSQVPQTVSSN